MNKPNFDSDRNLVAFLKQNQPIPPAPDPNLQASIMAQVSTTKISSPFNFKKLGLISAAIVTTLSLVIMSQPRQMQTAFNEAEVNKIDNSLINNWHLADEEFTTGYSLINTSSNQ
jgi:hypothetical protein